MGSMLALKKSITNVLETNFPLIEIYSSETKEGFEEPAFFTQIVPVLTDYETVNFTSNKAIVVINYFSEEGTELENLKMYDEIKKAFGMTLKVNQRSFLLKNINSSIVDEVLQFKFDLDYFVDIEKTNSSDIMQELDIEIPKE